VGGGSQFRRLERKPGNLSPLRDTNRKLQHGAEIYHSR
jgi:hypothetical protein